MAIIWEGYAPSFDVRTEIGQLYTGDVVQIEGEADETGHGCLVAYHLRNIQQGGLEGSGATGDESCRRMGEQGIGLILNKMYARTSYILLVIGIIDRRCASEHELIVFEALCRLNHRRQIVLDLLSAAACEESDDGFLLQAMTTAELLERLMIRVAETGYLFSGGVAYIVDGVMVFLLVEVLLERQYGEEFVDITLDGVYAPFLPSPYLRRDVIEDFGRRLQGGCQLLLDVLGNLEIEARIVDEDDGVGSPAGNVLLTHLHIAEDGGQMEQYGYEAHVCQLVVVAYACATYSRHVVTSEEPELGIVIVALDVLHQSGCMEVATRLAYYQIILHFIPILSSFSPTYRMP